MKCFFLALFFLLPVIVQAAELETVTLNPPARTGFFTSGYTENPEGQTTYEVTVRGKTRTYQAYAPQDDTGSPRAAILLLHGAGRSGVSLVEKWKDLADEYNIILIGPNGTNNRWDMDIDGPPYLNAILKDAGERYTIDPTQLYLFGHSMGGCFALYLSVVYSEKFAATALHAGKFGNTKDYAYIDMVKRKIPVAFLVGDNDPLFPLDMVTESAQAFADRDHETKLYILENHNHWYYDRADFINRQAWDFLSRHRLD